MTKILTLFKAHGKMGGNKMKTKVMLSMAALAFMFSNCSNEELENKEFNGVTSITATIEQPNMSRSTVDIDDETKKGIFSWANGDQISVYNGSKFDTLTYNETIRKFVTSSPITPNLVAFYPANNYHEKNKFAFLGSYDYRSVNGKTISTYAPMMATINDDNPGKLLFKHLGGVILFNLKNVQPGIDNLKFTTDKKINNKKTIQNGQVFAEDGEGNNTVTIYFDKVLNTPADLKVYIPVPVGEYNTFKVELYNGSGLKASKTTTNKHEIKRGTLLVMPEIEITTIEPSSEATPVEETPEVQ